jgi:HAD superfamily hydrolase (TIGR01490 family)
MTTPESSRLTAMNPSPDALPIGPDGWPRFEKAPKAAFLDVDGTLLAETTTYLFARILRRRGLLRRSFILRAMYHGLQHKFGRLDYGRLVGFGLRNIATIPVVELERIAAQNFEEFVRPRLFEGVVEHLAGLREQGTEIILVSSSPGIVIEPLSRYLGCTSTLTTPVRFEDGCLVGLAEGPPCYGEGKLYWAERWADERKISMDETVAYADNWSDRALLARVGRAVAVRPHRKLKRLALHRGWTIAHPRRPSRRDRRSGLVREEPDE